MPFLRDRTLHIAPGILPPGPLNAITDVAGVTVGHVTLIEGESVRTGVTAIRPHPGNTFQDKTPAGFAAGNGFGKFAGATQIAELSEIETPIVLTNTLSVAEGIAGLMEWTLAQPGYERVLSVNAVVPPYRPNSRASNTTGVSGPTRMRAASGCSGFTTTF